MAAFNPDEYLKEKGQLVAQAPDVAQGSMRNSLPGDFDPDKYLSEKTGPEPSALRKGLGIAGKVLDYPGGLLRTGLASVAGLASGNPNVVGSEDVKQAFKGSAPTSAEYLERMGVSPGPSVDLPSAEFDVPYIGKVKTPENISLRDAEGFAFDVMTDPLTALTRAGKLAKPVGAGAEAVGTKVYKSGLKKVDEKLLERGAKPVSDLLLAEGKAGTTKQLQKDAKEIGKRLGQERERLYERATGKGVSVDMAHPLVNAEEELARMRSDPGLAPMADSLQETLDRYKAGGRVDIATLSDWKTNLYNALPQTAYDANGRLSAPAKKFQKALANDFKQAIVDAGNKAEKGLGDKIDRLNDKWATVIQADKPLTMQVRRGNTSNLITPVDAMLTGMGAATSHSPLATAGILAAKKGVDLSKTTAARTHVGRGLVAAGKSGLLDAVARRGLIGAGKDKKGLIDEQRSLLSGDE